MDKMETSKLEYNHKVKHNFLLLCIEICLTILISISVVVNGCSTIQNNASQSTQELSKEYQTLIDGYVKTFSTMLIPIKDKLATNPSFDEISQWMLTKDDEYKNAFGGDEVYDGIAFTYKGGYVHSWNYGDYSNYDPNTRPWYQQAQKANGEVAIVAPYVTYLDTSYLDDDGYIVMTIAQKYNEEICFDLDLKIREIRDLLSEKETNYASEKIFLYDNNGYILTSTNDEDFAHNVTIKDKNISQSFKEASNDSSKQLGKLSLQNIDGDLNFTYSKKDSNDNTICVMVPFMDVFVNDFLGIIVVTLAMIIFEIFMYFKNRRNAKEFMWRDIRLSRVADAAYHERVYIDLKSLTFSKNNIAQNICKENTYNDLYDLLNSRLVNKDDEEVLADFLSVETITNWQEEEYLLITKRFMLNMADKDGNIGPRTIELGKMKFECDGKPMMVISMRDATESVDLLQQALKDSQKLKEEKEDAFNRFMGYICTAQDGVEELNIKDHTITRYFVKDNQLVQKTVPYPNEPWKLFHEEDRKMAEDLYNEDKLLKMCQNQEVSYQECRMKWNDASEYRWCNVIVLGIPISDINPFNVLVLIKDVNEIKVRDKKQRKALEDAFELAKQGSQAKGSFLSKMSHEIRTPLNAIIGYLSIAQDEYDNLEKVKHCIDNSQIASKHLLQIINDVLDMSSIENGKMKIANEEFDLKKEISDITAIFYQNSKAKNIRFDTHIDELLEEWVIGDQLRLNQVLMNLLSNAVKFTNENGQITFSISQLDPDNDSDEVYIKFIISDNGIGMSKEYISKLFTPFEQESASTARKYGGSGLGLSITHNLVHLMGGTIEVNSVQNEGTTFTVMMHFSKSRNHESQSLPAKDYAHIHVLVVDDTQNDRSYVKAMLKRCGVKADSVDSGAKALKRIKSRNDGDYSYDMCILDWNMPEMNGIEVAKKIREEFGKKLPIIIATAYDVSEFEEDAKLAGVDRVISKPLFQSTLFDILVSTFGTYQPTPKVETDRQVDLNGVHILLAEDNAMNMDIAVTVLEKSGVKVDQAVDGKQAYDKFMASDKGTYDLILMDVQMPILDGYQATRMIRESHHEEAQTIPIIAMTANAFREDVAEALSKGMNAHIAKPINYDKLFSIVKQFSHKK